MHNAGMPLIQMVIYAVLIALVFIFVFWMITSYVKNEMARNVLLVGTVLVALLCLLKFFGVL